MSITVAVLAFLGLFGGWWFSCHFSQRRWYVVYPDGVTSRCMCYDDAHNYRKAFGGKVFKR